MCVSNGPGREGHGEEEGRGRGKRRAGRMGWGRGSDAGKD